MLRDLRQNIIQFLSIFIMCFVALFVFEAFDSDTRGFGDGVDTYYRSTNFLDMMLASEGFTGEDLIAVKNLPDVETAELRTAMNGKVRLSSGTEAKLEFNFIGDNNVSQMLLTEGEPYDPGDPGIWIDRNFAGAKNIRVGDSLSLILDGTEFTETVRGIMDNPEHMYFMIDETYAEPEYGEYGFAYLDGGEYPGESLTYDRIYVDLNSVDNQFFLTGEEEAALDSAKVDIMGTISKTALSVIKKTEEIGYDSMKGEMEYNLMMETIFPGLFVFIALLGVMTTMTRLVTRQRTLIGALKALGFSREAVMWHYISYAVVITLLGSTAGAVVGYWTLGVQLHANMNMFYSNPYARMKLSILPFLLTAGISVLAGLTNYFACRRLLSKNASEILKPEPPAFAGAGFIEKTFLWKKLGFAARWNLRDVNNNRLRTVTGILGVIMCSSLMVAAFGSDELSHRSEHWEYNELNPAAYTIGFSPDADYVTVYDYARQYRGQMVEKEQVEIEGNGSSRLYNLVVVDKGNLYRFQDENGNYMELPENGMAISAKAAEVLDLKKGEVIKFKFPDKKEYIEARATAVYKSPGTQGIVMTREFYEGLKQEFKPNIVYTDMTVPKNYETERPEVANVTSKEEYMRAARDKTESMNESVVYTMIVSVVIGIVVMYNMGVLSFVEKTREIATLKVLGFTTAKIRWILQQQNIFITGTGTAVGLMLGIKVLGVLEGASDPDADSILQLSPGPYIYAFFLAFVLSLIVNAAISSKVKDINMVEALKGVE